jgi:hypothetical protein
MKNIFNIFIVLTGINFSVAGEISIDSFKKVADVKVIIEEFLKSLVFNNFHSYGENTINNKKLNEFNSFKEIERQWIASFKSDNFKFNWIKYYDAMEDSTIEDKMIGFYILSLNSFITFEKREQIDSRKFLEHLEEIYNKFDFSFNDKMNEFLIKMLENSGKNEKEIVTNKQRFEAKKVEIIRLKTLIPEEKINGLISTTPSNFVYLIANAKYIILDYFITQNLKRQKILSKSKEKSIPTDHQIGKEDQEESSSSSWLSSRKIFVVICIIAIVFPGCYAIINYNKKYQELKPEKINQESKSDTVLVSN